MIKRKIYSIGQGAFFSEHHSSTDGNDFTLVYDCGSDDIDSLCSEIDKFSHGIIDILVVSHFHEDHVNGLKYLINERKVKIRRVIIPRLSNLDMVIAAGCSGFDSEGLRLLRNPEEFFPGIPVSRLIDEGTASDSEEIIEDISGNIFTNRSYKAYASNSRWILKFYVDKTVFSKKLSSDEESFIRDFDVKQLGSKEYHKQARSIYSKLSRDINVTSISVYSGPSAAHEAYPKRRCGILLNGDAMLKKENQIQSITRHFKAYSKHIGFFGIPHHGSHNNMSRVLGEFPLHTAFVQSGKYSKHGHPSFPIIQMHLDDRIDVFVITEKSDSCVFEISYPYFW